MKIVEKRLPYGRHQNYPNLFVVHAMAQFLDFDGETISAWEALNRLRLSAHWLVETDGTIIQCRYPHEGAWHAKGYNTNSLGVEFLVPGVHDYSSFLKAMKEPYLTDEQYAAGLELVRYWVDMLEIREIARHSDLDPDRKQDPGEGFPWEQFKVEVFS